MKVVSVKTRILSFVAAFLVFVGCQKAHQTSGLAEKYGDHLAKTFRDVLPDAPIASTELTQAKALLKSKSNVQAMGNPIESSRWSFEPPVRLKAGDLTVKVDSPGYACPTMADVDGDEKLDLVVGQFDSGKMRFFKNVGTDNQRPRFAVGQWIKSGAAPATVKDVW